MKITGRATAPPRGPTSTAIHRSLQVRKPSVPVPERLFYIAEMTVDLVTLPTASKGGVVFAGLQYDSAFVNDTRYIAEAKTCRSWKQRHVGCF
jgi:hypothetical protein